MKIQTHLKSGRFFYMNGTQVYQVEGGDSLSKIALAYKNDAKQWRALYNANRDIIGPDPNKIKPGMILRLP